jgi:hypothetical protein
MSQTPTPAPARAGRDARIDLARGLTMLIIFVAHVPANTWTDYIPARMGFSSGAEAFVLCSGLACGIAFGKVFRNKGWIAGAVRILRRMAQLWLAQIWAFAAFAVLLLALDAWLGSDLLRIRYSLDYPRSAPLEAGLHMATLRYVPDYFDILPLYIVLLAATPFMVALVGVSPVLALGLSASLWLAVQIWPFGIPANPAGTREWFFNPLAWQFLFFIGFGATARWYRVPESTLPRIIAAAAIIIVTVPLTFWVAHDTWPVLGDINRWIYPVDAISTLHPFRLIHVLVLAWLFAALFSSRRASLYDGPAKPILVVGQQSLITFITGVFLSALGGVALGLTDGGPLATAAINIAGILTLIGVGYAARAAKAALKSPTRTTKEASPWLAAS